MEREIDAKKEAEAIAQMIVDWLSKKHHYFWVMSEERYRKRLIGTKYEKDEQFLLDVANRVPLCLKRKSVRIWFQDNNKFRFIAHKSRKYS